MLYVHELQKQAALAVGKSTLPDALGLVSEAIQWLVETSHTWEWAQRSTPLDLSTDDDVLPLPEDFGQLVSLAPFTRPGQWLWQTTISDLDAKGAQSSSLPYAWALQSRSGNGQSPPVPELRIYPKPNADTEDALTLTYTVKFTPYVHDGMLVEIPEFLVTLAKETCRVFALGRWEEDTLDLAGRLERLKTSSLFGDAVLRDSQSQINLGPMRPGMPSCTTGLSPKFDISYAPGQ